MGPSEMMTLARTGTLPTPRGQPVLGTPALVGKGDLNAEMGTPAQQFKPPAMGAPAPALPSAPPNNSTNNRTVVAFVNGLQHREA